MHIQIKSIVFGAAALALITGTTALALDAASVEKARQDFFHSLGKPSKGLKEELSKTEPDMTAVRGYVAQLSAAAPQLMAQFPAGSGPQNGLKTETTPEIWSNAAGFKQKNDAFQAAVSNLKTAAQGNNADAVRTAMAATGQACKSCHTAFRKEDH